MTLLSQERSGRMRPPSQASPKLETPLLLTCLNGYITRILHHPHHHHHQHHQQQCLYFMLNSVFLIDPLRCHISTNFLWIASIPWTTRLGKQSFSVEKLWDQGCWWKDTWKNHDTMIPWYYNSYIQLLCSHLLYDIHLTHSTGHRKREIFCCGILDQQIARILHWIFCSSLVRLERGVEAIRISPVNVLDK